MRSRAGASSGAGAGRTPNWRRSTSARRYSGARWP